MKTSTKTKVPELRFPEFEGEWMKKQLGSITSKIGSGKTPRGGSEIYTSAGIPFIRSQNVNNNSLILDETHIPGSVHLEMKSSKVKRNDILLNITGGSIGRSCVVPNSFDEGNINQHVSIIRLKKDQPYFLQPYLSSYKGQKLIFRSMTGSGREGLNFKSIGDFKIYFPSLLEQQKIADFLSQVDRKIDLLQQKVSALETYKKGVMQQLFSQEIRFKRGLSGGKEQVQQIRSKRGLSGAEGQDDGCDFPDWEEKKLGEIGNTYSGLSGKKKDDFGEGYKYIQYKQIFDNSKIDILECGEVSINESEKQNKVEFGDIFFTVSSETPDEIATASVFLSSVEETIYLNSFCFGYRLDKNIISPFYARYLFRSHSFRKKIIPLAQGSTRFNISKSNFIKLKTKLPTLKEQTKIANFLSSIDQKITHTQAQLEQTQSFKKGLLQKMFV
ncbi:type I restriction enzyme, S subunit [Psychroflexus salarius]|uniref:Type I restriction enzyme, S subunit n=1 Tax=Psychroflexus salarius TaxID=1155689 RepID=A0A1M4Y1Y0_9FLAO|nr:restriction endonuclease subunit S [Psychroflexus salarius]SHE99761.1 type I restriction enzyme, S subunit [Psychroflexus salarius]